MIRSRARREFRSAALLGVVNGACRPTKCQTLGSVRYQINHLAPATTASRVVLLKTMVPEIEGPMAASRSPLPACLGQEAAEKPLPTPSQDVESSSLHPLQWLAKWKAQAGL